MEAPTTGELKIIIFNIDDKLDRIHREQGEKLDALNEKADYTNGKLKKIILALTCIGSVVATLLVTNSSELLQIFKIII